MSEFALVIAQQSAHLYRLSSGQASLVAVAEPDENIVDWLTLHIPHRAYCSLVSDIMDESYVQSNLPPIWLPSTRQQLIERRLQQQVRDTPYRAAVLAPSGTWRPPTRASLIGMGQTERISEWLEGLTSCKVKIKGFWPLAALIAIAVQPKKSSATTNSTGPYSLRPMLAVVSTPVGLRQVLVRGKTPLFSRVSLDSTESGQSVDHALQEARRTVQYLTAQYWLELTDQPIAIQMWLPKDDEQARVEASNDPTLDLQALEVVDDVYARLLPLLKKAPTQTQFLPESYRTSWRADQITRNAKITGVVALVIASLWSAELLWESLLSRSLARVQIAKAAAINLQARKEVLQAKGDLSEAGLAVATVKTWEQTIAKQPAQLAAMQHLANGFKQAPGAVIQKLRWELPKQRASAGVSAETFGCLKPGKPEAAEAKPAIAILTLTLTLPLDLNQRDAVALQESLLAGLSTNGWAASIVKSSLIMDALQSQVGALGRVDARTLELCIQKTAV
jgi:hypothetical protein